MAKINISFNNKDYSIGESSFSDASDALQSHLSTVMNGSGAVITFGGTSYNIDSTKLSNAMNTFISHLGTIAGSGSKVVVNGVEYPVDSAKMDDAISELETALGDLASGGGSSDADVIASGSCGDNATWRLTENGVLTISGTGTMTSYPYQSSGVYSDRPWHDSITSIHTIVIEDGITSVGSYAFYGATALTSISLPDGITIGSYAFAKCTALSQVTLPDNTHMTHIGSSAVFYGCTSLTSVSISPNGETLIPTSMFSGCSKLQSITIPKNITGIGSNAFKECSSLTSVEFKTLSGWWRSTGMFDTGTSVSSYHIGNPSTMATYLKSTYVNQFFRRT